MIAEGHLWLQTRSPSAILPCEPRRATVAVTRPFHPVLSWRLGARLILDRSSGHVRRRKLAEPFRPHGFSTAPSERPRFPFGLRALSDAFPSPSVRREKPRREAQLQGPAARFQA